MSGHQGSQRLRRNGSPSVNKCAGPLRATIPVSFMSQNLIHHSESKSVSQSPILKSNPPISGRSRQSPWKIKQCSPTFKGSLCLSKSRFILELFINSSKTVSVRPKVLVGIWLVYYPDIFSAELMFHFDRLVERREAVDITSDSPSIRRTASLDAIYLKGQWPKDSYEAKPLVDKSSQTPEEWQEERR